MTAHAKLSASGSHRWLACPASVEAERGIADKSSPHAFEGTVAHELAEVALKSNTDADEWVGKVMPETHAEITQEMADHVQEYINYVRYHIPPNAYAAYEVRVDFSDWVPEGFGTCDALIIGGDTMHVIDLKYGQGVQVSPVDNSQGMLYALGAYAQCAGIVDIQKIIITIVQPRCNPDIFESWEISIEQLLEWGEYVKSRALMCGLPDAEFNPGEKQCQWCKAKATCTALAAFTSDVIMNQFDEVDELTAVNRLTDEQLGKALSAKKLIISWLDAVEDVVVERLGSGVAFEGYKLVAGKSNRQWSNEGAVENDIYELLGEEAYTKKLVSPAQAEKIVGKKRASEIATFVVKPQGRPTLAKSDDPRPAVNITADDF
jgi:hypothetical protein